MKLKDRVAIITGAASGIGRAIASTFAGEGAAVVVADLNEEGARRAAREIEDEGGRAVGVAADITKSLQVQAMVRTALERFGTIDILVNNAGIQHVAPIADLEEEKWNLLVAVHLTGAFLCAKALLPTLLAKRYGRIIHISSVHGKIASKFKAPYVAAKHGLIGFSRVLALETAEYGITSNAICPGYVRTPMVENQIPRLAQEHGMTHDEVLNDVILKDVPQKRLLEPEEVARLALYLAGSEARGITGQAINISAGWCMD